MKNRSFPFQAFVLSALLALPGATKAAVILTDDFTGATGGGSAINSTVDSTIDWVKISSGGTVGAGAFNTSGNTTTGLTMTGANSFKTTVGNFGTVLGGSTPTLSNVGDVLSVAFDFRAPINAGNQTSQFRFGLGSSTDSYILQMSNGTNNTDALVRYDSVNGVSGTNEALTTIGAGYGITGTGSHTFFLSLTRTALGIDLVAKLDGDAHTFTASDINTAAIGSYTFDRILLMAQKDLTSNITYNIDNVVLEYTSAVPEPSTYALLGLGMGALWILRRKSGRS